MAVAAPLPMSLQAQMADKRHAWDALVRRHQLQPVPYDEITAWAFAGAVLGPMILPSGSAGPRRREAARSRAREPVIVMQSFGDCARPPRGRARRRTYGFVVESVNVSVRLYAPVRRASLAPMCWRNVIAIGSLETGPVHETLLSSTRSDRHGS